MIELFLSTLSNTIDKYIIITFSIVNNPYLCHPYIFNWKLFFKIHHYILLGSCPEIPCWKISGYFTRIPWSLYLLASCSFQCQFSKEQDLLSGRFFFHKDMFFILAMFGKTHSSSGPKFVSYMLLPLPSLQLYLPGAEKVPGGGMMILISLQIDKLVIMAKNFVN